MSGQQTEEVKPNIKVEHENQDSLSTQQHDVTINIPSLEDSVPATLANWDAILETVKAGRSIAGATGYSATPHLGKNEKTIAESQMTPQEHQMWTGFNDGRVNLPALDWATNRLSPPTSKGSVKVIPRRVEALNRLYKTNQADAGHIAWIMEKELLLLPLIKAMARVIGAEKDLAGSKECQEGQLAEIQSINRILSVTGQICQGSASRIVRFKGGEVQQVLSDYKRTLQRTESRKRAREESPNATDRKNRIG